MKRAATSVLWFVSILCLYEVLVSVAGAPRAVGPLAGALAALIVFVDPGRRIWSDRAPSISVPATTSERPTGRRDPVSVV